MAARVSNAAFARLTSKRTRGAPRVVQTEASLLRAVKRWLTLRGLWFLRVNAGAATIAGRFVRMAAPGCADLLLLHRGRAIWLELKAAAGRQRDSQKAFQAGVEQAGAVYLLVKSLDELEAALRAEGVVA